MIEGVRGSWEAGGPKDLLWVMGGSAAGVHTPLHGKAARPISKDREPSWTQTTRGGSALKCLEGGTSRGPPGTGKGE